MRDLFRRLYSGDNDVDFVGRWRQAVAVTLAVLAITGGALLVRGLDLSIEFEGGTVWEVPAGPGVSVDDVSSAAVDAGVTSPRLQELSGETFRVRGAETERELTAAVRDRLAELNGVSPDDVSVETVGPTWGDEITDAARSALIWFFVLIALYIAIRFEWRMAVGALAAVVHDILVTVGFYALFQFEVTPATVIAFLTIMGYSLYDTIVVFDKVRENTSLMSVRTTEPYERVVNRSMNQVVMRSINTTVTSVLPILSMLVVGSFLLGAAALREFALALLVGMLAGTYSSVFVATPILVGLRTWRQRGPQARVTGHSPEAAARPVPTPEAVDAEATAGRSTPRRVAAVSDAAAPERPAQAANPARTGGPPRPRRRRRR